jgi:hypothetical protein
VNGNDDVGIHTVTHNRVRKESKGNYMFNVEILNGLRGQSLADIYLYYSVRETPDPDNNNALK